MPDKFDPYREALIVEESTNWPEELEDLSAEERAVIERQLHADPESATHLTYVRVHTGFCREIVVTPEDVQRLRSASA